MSSHLQWMLIKKHTSFLLKGNGQTFSREPNNLKNRNTFRFNGLVHKRTVGIQPAADGKGVVVVTRNNKKARKPCKTYSKVELKKDSRRTLSKIRKTIGKSYRKDLNMAALRRASAILKSQRPVVVKKTRGKKKE